jgi:uncharacterized protein (DUF1015 family)
MARIEPFRGIRPVKELADKVALCTNNLMNEDERRIAAQRNPLSFAHVVKPRIDFPEGISKQDEKLFDHAANYFQKLFSDGTLIQDEQSCFYIYRQTQNGRTQTGLVARYHVDEYACGNVKKHENTRAEKESENVKHLLATGIQGNPIFLAYEPVGDIDTLINSITAAVPDYHFLSDYDIYNSLWVVGDAEIVNELSKLFSERVGCTYIADGHHRAVSVAIAAKQLAEKNSNHTGKEDYNYMLTCLFPANQLKIYDYNRLVKDLYGLTEDELLKNISKQFSVTPVHDVRYQPDAFHEFGMYLGEQWYKLVAKDGTYTNDPIDILDVSILQKNILEPLLGIHDPRTDKRIEFVDGTKGINALEKRVNKGKAAVAFSLYPVTMKQLFDVADAGKVMPPKSTWFEPKLISGLVIYAMTSPTPPS